MFSREGPFLFEVLFNHWKELKLKVKLHFSFNKTKDYLNAVLHNLFVMVKKLREHLKTPEGHIKMLMCKTCNLNIKLNPPDAANVLTFVKFSNVEKT